MKTIRSLSLNLLFVFCTVVILTLVFLATGSIPVATIAAASPQEQTIYCGSDDMHRHFCPVEIHGRVELVNQKSGSQCIQDSTWGYDARGIWVDRGCRADFAIRIPRPVVQEQVATITCASDDERRHGCPVRDRTRHPWRAR